MQKHLRLEHVALAFTLIAFATTGRAPGLAKLGPRDLLQCQTLLARRLDEAA
ncbi:MAG: hypothetical protein AVDCRST_MAG90-666 [uncultured Microvirga sp.]|uniref:Uncharacterized protein n=1 Tax=uncultured Microvirga sp. TaxID=412392 RepID=A0A6J4KYF1_9HYPH|nr:MAG: hypothetical protein AVDCRST_MAG90-666 [uncultured Microvirga sp.]